MPSPGRRQLNMRLAPEDAPLVDEMLDLARSNGRDLVDEVVHAMRRHLRQPPKVRTVVEEEMLAKDTFEPPAKRGRGRPKKDPPPADAEPKKPRKPKT